MKKIKSFKKMEQTKQTYFLNPSKIFVSRQSHEVITVLGSCVSVCLYDKKKQYGGINHYMLPFWNGKDLPSPKFGSIAIEKLINKMIDLGSNKHTLVAKIFGGSEVIQATNNIFRIGPKNVEIAHQMLDKAGIPIISQSTGNHLGRKVLFRTSTGEVLMKYVKRQYVSNVTNIT
jgi:chemotaxis protein CheD